MSVQPVRSVPVHRLANKAEVAEWFGVSVPTVDAWLRRGVPYVTRGGRGQQWQLDLRDVAEWYYGRQGSSADEDPDKLPPKDRLDWYRGTRERTRHMQEIGELIPAADYESALAAALKTVASGLESLPDLLERDAALPGQAVERAIAVIDGLRDSIYQRLANGHH
jgi:phage terminase Nu1 subunit (DNA packaging protein)